MRPDLPSGTVTFLFTDVEGSTRLLHELGPETYATALDEHRRLLRGAFAGSGGVEVDTQGDALFVAFSTADGAATAALTANAALAAGPIRVRTGLHTGVATVTNEGYVGLDVHRAARIAALGHGGQILVSPTTAPLLDTSESTLRDLGQHRLKDFDGLVRLSQLGDGEFSPLRTPGSVDLPTPATAFVGREGELFAAVSLVYDRDPRVLTIVGPGGTGKTRFAIELARLLAEDADGGTVFVSLAPLRDADLLRPAIADALGATEPHVAAIAARVADRRTHVVCDNLEQLLPAAAGPLGELAAAVPALRMIATSREALRVQGETELDLPPLDPEEAMALFCERAQAVRPDVVPSETVARLCGRLDRLPLALELAAARTKLLAPELLLERLGDRLDLLKGTRDADERHATLRATIAWSHELLDDDERRLFARLAVFRAGCTLESAEAVCEAELDTLASLLDKSLLRRRTGRQGEERFWMLETIREFAAELLEKAQDAAEVHRRHAVRMLEIARKARLRDEETEADVGAVLAERDDLRGALDWAEEDDPVFGLELAVALQAFWNTAAPEGGMRRLEALLQRAGPISPRLRADVLCVYSGAADLAGEDERAAELSQESLRLYREIGDEYGVATVEHMMAVWAWRQDDWPRVRELTDHSIALARGKFVNTETAGYWLLGQIALHDGDLEGAIRLTQEGAERARATGWSWWESGQLHELLMLALRAGDLEHAEQEGLAALRLERDQENRLWALYTIAGLAQVALARGDLERAGILWGAAEAEGGRLPRWPNERARRGGALLDEKDPDFAAAYETGGLLDIWDAAEVALA
jgi:predicted ATPase/class 3 adenylate cyclase